MQPAITRMSVEEFEAFAAAPENRDRHLEFINGEIVEMVSSIEPSEIGFLFGGILLVFVRANKLGMVTGADGGYKFGGERVMPDVGFVKAARVPANKKGIVWFPGAPDLAVEVISPTDKAQNVRIKLSNYLAAETTVWLVDPDEQTVEVHTPGQPVQVLHSKDTLTGGTILPGFTLKLTEIWGE
jgi:Uma2 family endonuclease